jgi:YfiR/HmsC-like
MALLIKWVVAPALLALCTAAYADLASENDLKTAFVYNFIVLSTWPADSPPVMRLCIAGAPPGAIAFSMLAGKALGDRKLAVESVVSADRAGDCQALYIPRTESARLAAWLAAAAKRPMLTITDEAAPTGAMVNLRVSGDRIVFDVDTRAAAAARIGLSSQLIKLAATRQ